MTLWAALGWLMLIAPAIGMFVVIARELGWQDAALYFVIVLAALAGTFWLVLAAMLVLGEVP